MDKYDIDSSQVLVDAIQTTSIRLHEIASRSQSADIASEVVRLNDGVLATASPLLGPFDHPLDFQSTLLAEADVCNGAESP